MGNATATRLVQIRDEWNRVGHVQSWPKRNPALRETHKKLVDASNAWGEEAADVCRRSGIPVGPACAISVELPDDPDGDRLCGQMEVYERLMEELVFYGEYAFLLELVRDTDPAVTDIGAVRESAAEALLRAGAFETVREISRMDYEFAGYELSILIDLAKAGRNTADLARAREVLYRRFEPGSGMVSYLIRLYETFGSECDLESARRIAASLPPQEKVDAYLSIGKHAKTREDYLQAIAAANGLATRKERSDTVIMIVKSLCIYHGIGAAPESQTLPADFTAAILEAISDEPLREMIRSRFGLN